MTSPSRFGLLAALALLAGCTTPASEMPAATAAAPASPVVEDADELPLERHEVNAQCWMKYDKSGGSLEAKAKLVDKCVADKMKGKP